MFPFIESILLIDHKMPLLHWHQQRFERTQLAHYGRIIYPSIEDIISKKTYSTELGMKYKCRIVYTQNTLHVDIQPYSKKQIDSLSLLSNDTIDYSYKSSDRQVFETLQSKLKKGQEAVIVRAGMLTDTTFTNIALWDGQKWWTPKSPLLKGVQRAYLLEHEMIFEKNITIPQLKEYSAIKLFNSLNNWDEAWQFETNDILIHNQNE